MGRCVIIPEASLDEDHLVAGSSEPTASRAANLAIPGASNGGELEPVASGTPDAAVDIDLYVRTPGNVDGARVGWRDHNAASPAAYRGKSATHIPHDMTFLEYGTTSSTQPQRLKALPLASGALLLLYMYADGQINYRVFTPGTGWSAGNPTTFTTGVSMSTVVNLDAVQMPDTGEIVVIVAGYDSSSLLKLARLTSKGDTASTIAWRASPVSYTAIGGPSQLLSGMAMEILPNGRIAMLAHIKGLINPRIVRSYSDDRGVSWVPFVVASPSAYPEKPDGSTPGLYGGVAICRSRTGSLVAAVGVGDTATSDTGAITAVSDNGSTPTGKARITSANHGLKDGDSVFITGTTDYDGFSKIYNVTTNTFDIGLEYTSSKTGTWTYTIDIGFTTSNGLLLLVSDDGDSWCGMIRDTEQDAVTFDAGTEAWDRPLTNVGMMEAGIAVGDDGLVRVIGNHHGDSSDVIYGDLAMFTLRKIDISGSDVGPQFPDGMDSVDGYTTCTDAIDAEYFEQYGMYLPDADHRKAYRSVIWPGTASGNLDVTPDYSEARFVEVVNYRGALWVFCSFEDTTNTQYALGYFRCNVWTELEERPSDVSAAASYLQGFPYVQGYAAFTLPTDAGLTVAGAGTQALDATSGGVKFTTAANTTYAGFTSISGTADTPFMCRFKVLPTSGGDTTADYIALRIQLSDGVNYSTLSIRFATDGIAVYDAIAPLKLGGDTGLTIGANGIEVAVGYSDFKTLFYGVFYRELNPTDPEDTAWKKITLSGTVLTTAVGTSEFVRFGSEASSTAVSTWYDVRFGRLGASGAASPAARLRIMDSTYAWDAATPVFEEFVNETIAFDDGLRHGTRAPRANSDAMYFRDGMRISWQGAAAQSGDSWELISTNLYAAENVMRIPVGRLWRSAADNAIAYITWDAGNDKRFNPDAIALFKLNVASVTFEMDDADTFDSDGGSPQVSVACAIGTRREFWQTNSARSLGGADNREVRFTGLSAPIMDPHQFRSDDKVSWYAWSTGSSKSLKIVDNDGYTLMFAEDATGFQTNFISLYPDRIAYNLSGGNLGAAGGHRYMRLKFVVQAMPEDRFQLGYVVIGQKFGLDDPHPEWGWGRGVASPTEQASLADGDPYVVQPYDGALESYDYAFSALRGDQARAAVSTSPGSRGGYTRLLRALSAMKWGARPVALLPRYNDGRDKNESRTHEVIPCRVSSLVEMEHVVYDACDSGIEGTVSQVYNVTGVRFSEIS